MGGSDGKAPIPGDPDPNDEEAVEAAAEVLHPAIPPAAAAIIAETDPRLHRLSETAEELKELIESNEAAERDAESGRQT